MFSIFNMFHKSATDHHNIPRLLEGDDLSGHDLTCKQHALEAVDLLKEYKNNVHDFTDEIVDFWSLPQKVMNRYQLDDAAQLNEWLENM